MQTFAMINFLDSDRPFPRWCHTLGRVLLFSLLDPPGAGVAPLDQAAALGLICAALFGEGNPLHLAFSNQGINHSH